MKDRWLICNKLLGKRKSTILPDHTCKKEVANRLNNFFVDKIKAIRNDLEANPLPLPPDLAEPLPAFTGTPLSEFPSVTDEKLRKVITDSRTTSCDLDPLPTWLLKMGIATFLPILLFIVNLSLATGSFTSSLKKAYVTPLLKKLV